MKSVIEFGLENLKSVPFCPKVHRSFVDKTDSVASFACVGVPFRNVDLLIFIVRFEICDFLS